MDPNLFHIDWERTLEAIVAIIILSFLVERVAALVFESRWFVRNAKVPKPQSEEAERELDNVRLAVRIAGGDADATSELQPDSPLWPPNSESSATMAERANAFLASTRSLRLRRQSFSRFPVKEFGAFALAAFVCWALEFDALAILFLLDGPTLWGEVITGAVIAGGSKASIKLFQDVLGVRSQATREMQPPGGPRGGA